MKAENSAYKTLGLIGCGRIGQKVANIAKLGFNMEVIGYDIKPCPEAASKFLATKEDVLSKSRLHQRPHRRQRRHHRRKRTRHHEANRIHHQHSRGNNIDQQALYLRLKDGKIAGYATDVYKEEPKAENDPFTDKLKELDNVVMSSHLGASTVEAQSETSTEMARVLSSYLLGGDFTNAVNAGESIEVEEKEIFTLFIHHKDVPGVFANIDKVLADSNINIRANYSRQINTGLRNQRLCAAPEGSSGNRR